MELPSAAQPDHWVPFAVVWPMASAERARACQRELVAQGFGVALLASNKPRQPLKATMFALRQAHRIDQGAAHAVIGGDRASIDELLAHRHEFQTVTVLGEVADADLEALRRLRTRRVHALADADAAAVAAHVATLHRGRALKGPAAEVALTLDAFHHAAAVGDEARYFEIFPDDAVFLGTDPRERWSGKQFKQFAMRYFERPSAWIYVPLQRHVTVAEGGQLAWFDEVLDNASYGECRGTGVLVRRDGAWVLQQYNLTVPVPNDLMADVARQIRAHVDGR